MVTGFVGQALIDIDGAIVSADDAFCAIMGGGPDWLRGHSVVALAAEEDRADWENALLEMIRTHAPIATTQRYLRPDGSTVRVRATVSLFPRDGCSDCAVFHAELAPDHRVDHPALLLARAQFLRASDDVRAGVMPLGLNLAWDLVLAIYVAEAKGRDFSIDEYRPRGAISSLIPQRWLGALEQSGIVECEGQGEARTGCYRLSTDASIKLEHYLGDVALDRDVAVAGPAARWFSPQP